jgi:ArsR family transcriptional regulator
LNLLFKALRDPTRRQILEMLKKGDLTVGEISEAFAMTTPSISYHLDLLKHAQLVSARKNGQFVTYSLETTVLDESLGWLLDLIKKPNGKRK